MQQQRIYFLNVHYDFFFQIFISAKKIETITKNDVFNFVFLIRIICNFHYTCYFESELF